MLQNYIIFVLKVKFQTYTFQLVFYFCNLSEKSIFYKNAKRKAVDFKGNRQSVEIKVRWKNSSRNR